MENKIINGDCIEELKLLEENSVDAIVTDPPYGLSFMGKNWDYGVPGVPFWKEMLRVLKPGGFLLSFGGTRTYHRLACGIEDAGFEIRDCIQWLYDSGFPKSLNIGKQIDKINGKTQEEFIALGDYIKEQRLKLELSTIQVAEFGKFYGNINHGGAVANWEKGSNVPTKEQWIILKRELKLDDKFDYLIDRIEAEREVIEEKRVQRNSSSWETEKGMLAVGEQNFDKTAPATQEAKEWEGWGTALKPANEPIVVARKPLSEKNVALNVLKWGTGGINIDDCRIGYENGGSIASNPLLRKESGAKINYGKDTNPSSYTLKKEEGEMNINNNGIFPANINMLIISTIFFFPIPLFYHFLFYCELFIPPF